MAQEIFKRYEKKYLLNEGQLKQMEEAFDGVMALDAYGPHTIHTIYFDTEDFELIRTSLEKPVYKEKLRLRSYGSAADGNAEVFVEMKKKFQSVVYKRRAQMTLAEAEALLNEGKTPLLGGQIVSEIQYMARRYRLEPKVYLSYHRKAYFCKSNPELRLTLDERILGRRTDLDLRCGEGGSSILEEGRFLMEVKIPGAMPLWMSRLFSHLEIYPISFSKVGTYYQSSVAPEIAGRLRAAQIKRNGDKEMWKEEAIYA